MGGTRLASVVAAALLTASACTTHASSSTAPTSSSGSTWPVVSTTVGSVSEPTTQAPKPIPAGPALNPDHFGTLPKEGFAIPAPQGLVLVDLSGDTLGHFVGFTLSYDFPVPGPLLLDGPAGTYRLDPGATSLAFVGAKDGVIRYPLAYGAELVSDQATPTSQPGTTVRSYRMTRGSGPVGLMNVSDISFDRDLVRGTGADGHEVTVDLRTGERRTIAAGCDVADRHGASWYLLCGYPRRLASGRDAPENPAPTTIDVLRSGTRRTVVGSPPGYAPDGGWWRAAAVSPDGANLVAQWSGECEAQSVFFVTTSGKVTSLGSLLHSPRDLEAEIVGWTLDGRAAVSVPPKPGCGAWGRDGLFLIRPGHAPQRIHALPEAGSGVMWQPLLK